MIDKLIFECIEKHVGGEEFFDELDNIIQTERVFWDLLEGDIKRISRRYTSDILVILSGKFGRVYQSKLKDSILLEGALRFNSIGNQQQYYNKIKGKYCIFLDDSYFEGRTYSKVKELIANAGGVCLGAVVAYDGSHILNPEVESLFRYYDHFGNKET